MCIRDRPKCSGTVFNNFDLSPDVESTKFWSEWQKGKKSNVLDGHNFILEIKMFDDTEFQNLKLCSKPNTYEIIMPVPKITINDDNTTEINAPSKSTEIKEILLESNSVAESICKNGIEAFITQESGISQDDYYKILNSEMSDSLRETISRKGEDLYPDLVDHNFEAAASYMFYQEQLKEQHTQSE